MSKKYFYPVIFEPEEVGVSVYVPDIPGCNTQGDSLEEALEMVQEVIGLMLEGKKRLGQNHPLKLKKDWNLSFFSNSSPFTSRKIKLQLYAAYIFLNLLPSKPNPFLFLL